MRFVRILLALVAFTMCIQNVFSTTAWDFFGKVKSITLYRADFKNEFGKVVEVNRQKTEMKVYNLEGKLEKVDLFDEKGIVIQRSIYIYEDNRLIFWEFYTLNKSKLTLTAKTKYLYDKNNNLSETVSTSGRKTIYEYNGQNLLAEFTIYDADGTIQHKTTYGYDINGKEIERYHYLSDGRIDQRITFSYKNGLLDRQENYYNINSKEPDSLSTFTYYDNGLLKEENRYISYKGYKLSSQEVYDEKGNVIKISNYIDPIEKQYIVYEFDLEGNWVKQNIYEEVQQFGKSSLQLIERNCRVIEYYGK